MTAEVLTFDGVTRLDLPVERILEAAKHEGLTNCIVLGWTEDGDAYIAGTQADGGDMLWLMERAKHKLMQIADESE